MSPLLLGSVPLFWKQTLSNQHTSPNNHTPCLVALTGLGRTAAFGEGLPSQAAGAAARQEPGLEHRLWVQRVSGPFPVN